MANNNFSWSPDFVFKNPYGNATTNCLNKKLKQQHTVVSMGCKTVLECALSATNTRKTNAAILRCRCMELDTVGETEEGVQKKEATNAVKDNYRGWADDQKIGDWADDFDDSFYDRWCAWLVEKLEPMVASAETPAYINVPAKTVLFFVKLCVGKHKKETKQIVFDQLVGLEAPGAQMKVILQRLQESHGSHVLTPAGVLLWGPSGTGKSTLVHALAREAEVSFLPVAGEDLLRDEKGIGKLNSIFDEARQNAPSIIFIDGVEAVKAVKKILQRLQESHGSHVLTPAGVLLWGPSGTGKSTLVHALAREAEVSFLPVAGEDLLRDEKGIGKLNSIFDEARQNAPSIIFIDGVEAVKAVKKLTEQIDKCVSDRAVVLVVATVEKLHLVDEKLMGSLSTMIELKKPNLQTRQDMANVIIQKQETEVPEGEKETIVKYIASEMDGFVWKDISLVCFESRMLAMRRGAGVPMTLEDVREYIKVFKRKKSLREEKVREAKEDDKIKRAKALELVRDLLDDMVLDTAHKNQD